MERPQTPPQADKTAPTEDLSAFPPAFQMARNLVKQAWISGAGAAQGTGFLADASVANDRLKICEGCEFFRDRRCLKCGCFMDRKAHLKLASCPAGKWPGGKLGHPPESNSCHYPDRPLSVDSFPEEERGEIMRLAASSLVSGGEFKFRGELLRARMKAGSESIEVFKAAPVRKSDDFWTDAEKAEMQALVTEARRGGRVTVQFKGRTFNLDRGVNRRGGPTSVVEYFTQGFSDGERAAFSELASATKASGGHEFEFKGRKFQFGAPEKPNSHG
jgi:hypothetical protein